MYVTIEDGDILQVMGEGVEFEPIRLLSIEMKGERIKITNHGIDGNIEVENDK